MALKGLFQEVSDLVLSNKLTPDCIAARAIGYRQTLEYLCDEEWQAYDEKAFEKYV